ncbi:MAG: hypothetical protein D3914_04105 [Candidatus Electrothrix sp. LOE2]|nr:hypothetical protein [Candidatus Electrothrix sp. LOE2]
MISMAISSMVIGAIYGVYTIQQRSYTVQEQVSEMQQKGRAALDVMVRDMRMVTFTEGCVGIAKIIKAAPEEFQFQYCDEDTTTGAMQIYNFSYDLYDANGDGSIDLGRTKGGLKRALAEGVDALEFQYFDKEGNLTSDTKEIRSIQISLLIRASYPDPKYTDTIHHTPASRKLDWDIKSSTSNPPNDRFHRRLLITTVKLRNMGLDDE